MLEKREKDLLDRVRHLQRLSELLVTCRIQKVSTGRNENIFIFGLKPNMTEFDMNEKDVNLCSDDHAVR